LDAIKKVNPKSRALRSLRKRLKAMKAPTKKAKRKRKSKKTKKANLQCKGCNCSTLIRQLSMGIKPLTTNQEKFLQSHCR